MLISRLHQVTIMSLLLDALKKAANDKQKAAQDVTEDSQVDTNPAEINSTEDLAIEVIAHEVM